MAKELTLKDAQRIEINVKRDFEMMLRRICHRLRDHDDPKVREMVDQANGLLKRKGTANILRDNEAQ